MYQPFSHNIKMRRLFMHYPISYSKLWLLLDSMYVCSEQALPLNFRQQQTSIWGRSIIISRKFLKA